MVLELWERYNNGSEDNIRFNFTVRLFKKPQNSITKVQVQGKPRLAA